MWPETIVFLAPVLGFIPCVVQRWEPVYIQALVAETAIKRFNVRAICWFTRPREIQHYVLVVGPAVERLADKLAAIIDLDALGHPAQSLV